MPDETTITRHLKITFNESISMSDSFSIDQASIFSDSITAADTIQSALTSINSESMSLTDSYSSTMGIYKTLTDSMTMTDDYNAIIHRDTSDMVTDFASILEDIPSEDVTLRQTTLTADSLGNTSGATKNDVSIDGYFTSTSLKDRRLVAPGISITGLLTGYFEPSYTVSGTDYSVAEGDQIIRDSVTWRVIKLEKVYRAGSQDIYVKAIMRRE